MIAKLLLAPVLLHQGLRVRAHALRLPEAAGPREGIEGGAHNPALRLLVVGDSSAAGVGVATQATALAQPLARHLAGRLGAPVAWQLRATTGHDAAQALAALRRQPPAPADLMVTALGVNDVLTQTRTHRWLAALDALHAVAGVRTSLHSAVPPMGRFTLLPQPLRWTLGRDAARLDTALARHVRGRPGRHHVPLPALYGAAADWLAEDGFHPGPAGYQAWAAWLADAIMATCLPSTPR
ncbi:MAG: SGNH/GDSL hydrolase family protein [Proteobacteria bacterium]|nr:SGNH/GDSL hydrolase family protein [Pseudomonadota bacterium]